MIFPGWSQIKTWALAALGILSAVLFGLLGLNKAKHAKAKQKGIEEARKVEHAAQDEITKGSKRTQEKADAAAKKVDDGDYSHFES